MRVFAADGDGNTISLVYFNNPGWAKRSLPIGREAHRLGQARSNMATSGRSSIRRSSEPGKGPQPAIREPVYPLTEGLTNRRLGELAREALERAPELPEWIEPGLVGARGLARLARVTRPDPSRAGRRRRAQAARL